MNILEILNKIDDILVSFSKERECYFLKVVGRKQNYITPHYKLVDVIKELIEKYPAYVSEKQLAIIMIEELTGYEGDGLSYGKEYIQLQFIDGCGHHGDDEELNVESGDKVNRLVPIQNDGLPYLHLAGKVFKESV